MPTLEAILVIFGRAIDRNGFRRMKEEGLIYKTLPHIFLIFVQGRYDLSKFSDIFTPFFDFQRP